MKYSLKLAVIIGLLSLQSAVYADSFATDYADAAAQLDNVASDLTKLNQEVINTNTALAGHAQSINTVNTELQKTNEALAGHAQSINTVNTELQKTNEALAGHAESINTVNTELQKTNEAVGQNAQALASLNAAVASNRSEFARLDNRIDDLTTETRSAIAGVAAMSALVPNARAEGNTQIAIGAGTYRDEAGVAVGAFHYLNDNVLLNTAASYSHDNYAGRVGITFGW